jgi:hypothetical protein
MDLGAVIKAGFLSFALAVGCQMLVFYLAGRLIKGSGVRFWRVYVLAAVASFLLLDGLLYYKIVVSPTPGVEALLPGAIGGWFGGAVFGASQLKPHLLRLMGPPR